MPAKPYGVTIAQQQPHFYAPKEEKPTNLLQPSAKFANKNTCMFSCSLLAYNIHETEICVIRYVLNCTLSLKDNDSEPDAAEYFGFPQEISFSKKGIM